MPYTVIDRVLLELKYLTEKGKDELSEEDQVIYEELYYDLSDKMQLYLTTLDQVSKDKITLAKVKTKVMK